MTAAELVTSPNPWDYLQPLILVPLIAGTIFGLAIYFVVVPEYNDSVRADNKRLALNQERGYDRSVDPRPLMSAWKVITACVLAITLLTGTIVFLAWRSDVYACDHNLKDSPCWQVTTKTETRIDGDITVRKGGDK